MVGIIACLESVAFVGITVPGIALLFALSALAGSQAIPLHPLLVAGFVGAIVGDQSSFLLGRFASPWLEQRWPLRQHPQWRTRGMTFFHRYGGLSVVIGRFIGPFRPLIPFVAGSCRMSPLRFSLYNLFSAVAWSPAYLLPGYLAGMGAQQLPLLQSPVLELLILLFALIIAFQQLHIRLRPEASLWDWLQRRHIDPQRMGIMLLLSGSALLFLFCIAAQLSGRFAEANAHLYGLLYELGREIPTLSTLVTHLGDPPLVMVLAITCGAVGHLRYRQRAGWGVALGVGSVLLLNHLLKQTLAVARPEAGQTLLTSYSFPSGHASAASAFYALVAIWLLQGQSHPVRHAGYMTVLGLVLLIALSRTLLGVHWPLDIVAGTLEGIAVAALYRYWLIRHPSTQPVAAAPILALLLGAAMFYTLVRTLI
nr:bifunctional DedA family/phosphatase PAP2 family protein [Marinobacterium ramblicola]